MKSSMELKLECLKLANALGASKNILPKDVIPYAMEFYKWVDGHDGERASPKSVRDLKDHFTTTGRHWVE